MASIDVIRRAHGRSFKVRYRDPFGRARSQTFSSRADAERFLHQVESDKARGTYRDSSAGRALVADVFDAWLASRLDLALRRERCTPSWVARISCPASGDVVSVR